VARRAEEFSVAAEEAGTPVSFVLIPKKGLSVAEFKARETNQGGEEEVYRIFISK
jgi:hypothetical protein